MMTHTGHYPHVCSYCWKGFKQPSDFKAHMMSNTGEKPFVCSDCGKGFNRPYNLKAHSKKFHSEVNKAECVETMVNDSTSSEVTAEYVETVVKDSTSSIITHGDLLRRELFDMCTIWSRISLSKHLMIHTGCTFHVCSSCSESPSCEGLNQK